MGAQLCGIICAQFGVPDMLGMIFWGVLYRNLGFAEYGELLKVESFFRELALVNIMLLAGLGVDLSAAKEYLFSIVKLTFIPMAVEVVAVATLSHYLMGMPWIWAVLLGFIITAISPNVVVTVVMNLREQKMGSNVIHTIILAVTTLNDVTAIFCSGCLLGVIFSTGSLRNQILQGPVAIALGIIYGGVYGFFLGHLPSNYSVNCRQFVCYFPVNNLTFSFQRFKNALRFVLTICGGLFVVCGSKSIGFPAAGALGCAVLSITANASWKSSAAMPLASSASCNNRVDVYLNTLWKFVKCISFALIGKEVNFAVLEGAALYGVLVIVAAAILRLAFAYISMLGKGDLSPSERIYLAISSLPKATVQAAIGPLALEMVAKFKAEEHFELANSVLICSVLAIILTAPLGALLMVKLSPRLLRKEPDLDDEPL